MSAPMTILISVLLLAGNAFFVGAEFALISARRSAIEPLAQAGHKGARRTLAAMEQVSMMLAGAQLGITVCSLGLGALAEPALEHALEPVAAAVGLPDALVVPLSFLLGLAIVVYLHMVLGEMVPKNIALAGPERSALALAPTLAKAPNKAATASTFTPCAGFSPVFSTSAAALPSGKARPWSTISERRNGTEKITPSRPPRPAIANTH